MPRITALLALTLALTGCENPSISSSLPAAVPRARAVERAIWVTRFDYKTREDVERIVENCKSAGFNTILFQVRGNATVFYRSSLEPWAEQFGGVDPGFDPLQTAIEAAHSRGMRLAAWVNVMPAWWGKTPPTDPEHVVNAHPEWLWYDQHGARQPYSEKFYVSLNPCLPKVRKHIVAVLRDVAARYSVDEIHLDYIRFPNEQPPGEPDRSKLDYPRDETTVGLFEADSGKKPEEDPAAWDAWRTEQVTILLREIRSMMRETRPRVELTAAVGAVPENALHHHQDAETWLEEDLLDVVYPMNYTRDLQVFHDRATNWRNIARGKHVVMGVSLEQGDMAIAGEELELALKTFNGFAVYAYSSMFDSANDSIANQDEATRFQRQQRRHTILPVLLDLAKNGGA
jgi:uncharacterized lipoprotein YddW (UPF0748 family)